MGKHDIKFEYHSAWGLSLGWANLNIIINHASCEPTTVKIGAATPLKASLTTTTTVTGVDLTKAFSTTTPASTVAVCKYTYTLAWTHATHTYNSKVRTATVLSVAADGKASVALKASDNHVDGIHVFTISVKSLFGASVAGTNTLTVTKTTSTCEKATLITQTTATAKGPFLHKLAAAAAKVDWAGAWASSITGCAFQYSVTVPSAMTSYVTVSADKTAPELTLKQIANSGNSLPLGRHDFVVKYWTVGGIDTKKEATLSVRVNYDKCEATTGSGLGTKIRFTYNVAS